MDPQEYQTFINEFEQAHLFKKEKLRRTDSNYGGIGEAKNDLNSASLGQTQIIATFIPQNQLNGSDCCCLIQ